MGGDPTRSVDLVSQTGPILDLHAAFPRVSSDDPVVETPLSQTLLASIYFSPQASLCSSSPAVVVVTTRLRFAWPSAVALASTGIRAIMPRQTSRSAASRRAFLLRR